MGEWDFLNPGADNIQDGFLAGIILQIVAFINLLAAFTVGWINGLITNVGYTFHGVISVFRNVFSFLSHIWNNIIKPIITRVINAIGKLSAWLEAKLKPIIDFLRKLQKLLDEYYKHFVKPFLNVLQKVRQALQVFKALGFKWAQQLDQKLALIQSKVIKSFNEIRGTLNAVIGVINIIADPSLLLRRPTLLASLRGNLAAIIRVVTGHAPGYFFPVPLGALGAAGKLWAHVPLNYTGSNPATNPPPSFYMNDNDGLPAFDFTNGADPPDNEFADSFAPVDFFLIDNAAATDCTDPIACFVQALQSARNTAPGA